MVYTHHGGDLNIDHRLTLQAVMTACRPLPETTVREILCFETLSSTEWSAEAIGPTFRPVVFVDISDTLDRKLEALRAYDEEMRRFPHARSYEAVKALAPRKLSWWRDRCADCWAPQSRTRPRYEWKSPESST